MFKNLTIALLTTTLLTTPALAGTQDVICLQQGLLDAGFDPNGVDGGIGNSTRSAVADWSEANPDADLPVLSNATARAWCSVFTPTSTSELISLDFSRGVPTPTTFGTDISFLGSTLMVGEDTYQLVETDLEWLNSKLHPMANAITLKFDEDPTTMPEHLADEKTVIYQNMGNTVGFAIFAGIAVYFTFEGGEHISTTILKI
jgi:hypothetical protein